MTFILLYLLPGALAYAEGGQRRYFFHALIALVADVIVAHTTFAMIAGYPKKNEWMVSQMLERLAHPSNLLDKNYPFYFQLALLINRQSPTVEHIKAVL